MFPGSSSLGEAVEDGGPVSTSLSESETCMRSTLASDTGASASGPRNATFLLLLYISTYIPALVHLGISTLAATSDLTFRIALYVLLKLAVAPGL
jgi:hypothetical protein